MKLSKTLVNTTKNQNQHKMQLNLHKKKEPPHKDKQISTNNKSQIRRYTNITTIIDYQLRLT